MNCDPPTSMRAYSPLNCGFPFVAVNAVIKSLLNRCAEFQSFICSKEALTLGLSRAKRMDFLIPRMVRGLFSAMAAAVASTCLCISSAVAKLFSTKPIDSASFPRNVRPVYASSRVVWSPTILGILWSVPMSATMARSVSLMLKEASSVQYRRSVAVMRSTAPPMQWPETAAITYTG